MATRTVPTGGTSANFQPGARVAYNVIAELWERASAGMDPAALQWFAGASEEAERALMNLHEVVEGIGCFVQGDNEPGGTRCGSFADSSSLLFFIEQSLGSIRGLLHVAGNAADRLHHPEYFGTATNKGGAA